MQIKYLCISVLVLSLLSCKLREATSIPSTINIPITPSETAQTPNLWIDQNIIHLTWSEEKGDSTTLYYTRIDGEEEYTSAVASGNEWFINWADFSSLISAPSDPKKVMTHWLEKSSEGTYDYNIKISLSKDGGLTWDKGKVLHSDGIGAEHGFVSVAPYDDQHFFASWLDGRNTKTPDPTVEGKNLPMSLRAGIINTDNLSITEYPVDLKVCDCCQTSSVMSSEGMLIAYRNRTDEEIRDITIQKFDTDGSEVVFQSDDKWKINGCPVNGPALASDQFWSAMVWYTAADSASVYLTYGNKVAFDQKIKIDNGNPLGRVDIEISNNKAYVSWLELNDQRAEIRLKTIDLPSKSIIDDQLISYTSAERRSGFPILKLSKEHAYVTFTEVLSADHTTVRLKQIKL